MLGLSLKSPPVSSPASSAAEEALLVLDSRRRVTAASPVALALLGKKTEDVLGRVFGPEEGWELEGLTVKEQALQRKGKRVHLTVVQLAVAMAVDEYDCHIAPWHASQELAVIRTAEGKILAVNEAFARKFGVPRRAWPQQETAALVHPEDLPQWRTSLARIALSPYRGAHEHRWQTAQGWRWLQWEDCALRDAEGLIVAYRSIGRDVTKRRLAEEHFQKLASAVEQSPFSIVMTTPDGRVQYVNPRYTQATGYTLEEIFEKQIPVLRHGHATEDSYRDFEATVQAGQRWSGELCTPCKDGRPLWELVQVSPIRNHFDEVTHLLCVREDITERKSLEDQLRQAQKMESLGTLAGGIAHDFNNILAIINGFAEIGLVRAKPDDPQTRNLREIHNAGQRAIGLVRQILTFSRKAESSLLPVSVNQQIRDLGRMCAETFPRTIAFGFDLDESLPEFLADPNQLQQVIMNLCVNARDAMAQGGTISLQTRRVPGAEVRRLGGEAGRDYVCIAVSDTGCGMSPAVRARIFEPFFTTKQNAGGTGLGLAVVYGIILNHRGFLDVQSVEGQGSTFAAYFPLETATTAVPAGSQSSLLHSFPRGTETLLVVEDERSLRELLRAVMEPAGYRLLLAADGEEALQIVMDRSIALDGVLLDLNLPRMNGVEIYAHLKSERPTTPVLVVSGNLTTEVRRELGEMGQREFLGKPYKLDELGRRVRALFSATQSIK